VEKQSFRLIHRSGENADYVVLPCGKLFVGCGKSVENESPTWGMSVESMGKPKSIVKFCKVSRV
jgi:hypothetical protein